MAITTVDGAIAGGQPARFIHKELSTAPVQGRYHSLWALNGIPAAGTYDTTLNGVALTHSTVVGGFHRTNPTAMNAYLARLAFFASNSGTLMICDRLWHNGNIDYTSTSLQAITSPTWPARDMDGATAGRGVLIGAEVSATMGAATPTLTLTYTNSAGTTDRSAGTLFSTTSGAVPGAFYPFALMSDDVGVQSVQGITQSASWVSGTYNLVAYRPIITVDLQEASTAAAVDILTGGLPRIYDNSVLYMMYQPSSSGAVRVQGLYTETHG